MRHALFAFLLTAPLLLPGTPMVEGQAAPPAGAQRPRLATGIYLNSADQGYCYVYRRRAGYLFVDEYGGEGLFAFTAPNTLHLVDGTSATPDVVATVGRDELGRITIRFDAPGKDPAFWVLAR